MREMISRRTWIETALFVVDPVLSSLFRTFCKLLRPVVNYRHCVVVKRGADNDISIAREILDLLLTKHGCHMFHYLLPRAGLVFSVSLCTHLKTARSR